MTLPADRKVPLRRIAGGAILAALALALVAPFAPTGEGALRSSFEVALKQSPGIAIRTPRSAPVAGSEDYWLSHSRHEHSVPVLKTVSIGDEIAVNAGGEARTFKIKSLSDYVPQLTAIDAGPGQTRLVLVTAYDKQAPGDRLVRFVIEVEPNSKPLNTGRAS